MSNQSGISCTEELISTFKQYIDSSSRGLVIKIENEQLVPGKLILGTSSLENDWSLVQNELSESDPAFVIVNKDTPKEHIFISFTPDYASVRSKMIYASSKNTLLRELGLEFFKPVIFVNELDEISSAGWKRHLAHEKLDNPLTAEEESLQRVKDFERLHVGTERKNRLVQDTSSTFMFLVDGSLKDKISSISNSELISCSIDLSNESIKLSQDTKFSSSSELTTLISSIEPQYTILKVNDKTSFIYSCPSGSKVKERMIYASSKLGFVNQVLKNELKLEISNVIEVGDLDEIELSLFEEGPKITKEDSNGSNLRFSRPKGPRRK